MNLKSLLETEFLPFVIRPARYIGNELGTIHKDDANLLYVAAVVCDVYEACMSYPALHGIYQSVNSRNDAVCERAFAPDSDAEQLLREKKIQLFSMESFRPLDESDLLLALLPGELCAPTLLTILDLSGLGLRSNERSSSRPLVGAVLPPCFNPEPIADFIDFALFGESEQALSGIIDVIAQNRGLARHDLLRKLPRVSGVYVPSLCEVRYDGDRTVGSQTTDSHSPIRLGSSVSGQSRKIDMAAPVVPFEEVAHDHLSIELVPSAGHKCRVCPALDNRSGTDIDPEVLADQIARWINDTGFDEVVLQANWSADYRHFDRLLELLANRLRDRQIRVTTPPLRPSMKAFEAIRKLAAVCGKQPLAFLLTAGSDRLREVMGRFFSIDEFYQVAANALASGWQTLRLHFDLGLPTETDADVAAIADVVDNCVELAQEYNPKAIIQVSLSVFVPRSQSRWQWEPQISPADYLAKVDRLRRMLKGRFIQISHRPVEPATVEGALARGDRRVGNAIAHVYEQGARFEYSVEYFDFARWQKSFTDAGLCIEKYLRQREYEELLPWDQFQKGATKGQLLRDCKEAHSVPALAKAGSGSFKLGDILLLKPELSEQILVPASAPSAGFGRRPKRKAEPVAMIIPRSRIRLQWSKSESARFVGHLATMRVFERAIRRAGLPVAYSQGHHPRQKLAFGPPLTLGYLSLAEYLDIQLETPFQQEMISKLNRALPSGYEVSQGRPIFGKATSLSSIINAATYEVSLPEPGMITQGDVDSLLSRNEVVIRRVKGDEVREADVRKSVTNLELRSSEGINILYMELTMGNLGFVKPEEILLQGLGLPEKTVLPLRVSRTELLILADGKRLTPFEVD